MSLFSPEVVVRLLQELTSNDEKYAINTQENLSYSIIWCLVRLLETEDEERIEDGIRIVLNYFHASPKIFQATFLQQTYVAARFSLTALLCSHAIRLGISFPSHLLVESTFRMTYKSTITQHLMGVGSNSVYNLGITSTGEVTESRLIPLSQKIKKISMSTHHSLFLTEDGSVYGCGKGNIGQLGSKLKYVVVEPTLVFQATVSVVDIFAGEGFSVFVTSDNKINLLGKFGKTGTDSGEPLKVQCEKKPFLGICLENESIIVRLRDWTYTCSLKEEGFSEQVQYYQFDPKAGLETITVLEVDLKPLLRPENSHHVTLKHTLTRIDTHDCERNPPEEHVNIPLGMIKAVVRNQSQHTMVIYSVHGLMLDLNVSQLQVAKNGKVTLVASTFSMDKKNGRPRSSCLYTGRAVLINEDSAADFEVVRDANHVSNYRVLFELEEFSCTHSVHLFGMSPDGANVIYLMDNDQDRFYLEERKFHKMKDLEDYKAVTWQHAPNLDWFGIPRNEKAVTNLEELNQRREEIGMERIGLDVFIPKKLGLKYFHESYANRRLDFIRAIYPAVDNHIVEGEDHLQIFQVPQKTCSDSLSTFLVLTLLSGQDILPGEAILSMYEHMMKSGYRKMEWETCLDPTERKKIFHEFLDSTLAEIGMKAVELLPGKYLLRSLAAENWSSQIAGDVTVNSSDGETLPFLWDILFFQSEYFSAVMSHGSGDNGIKIDFPMETVSSALRVFLEPNHLYDLFFEKLFVLIDLYDRYLCYAAIEDTLDVIFETVTEANIHLVYDLYERMEHLQPYLEQQFLKRTHLILYWKCARIPFGLLREMNKKIRADRVPQVKKVGWISGRYHQLMIGADFVNTLKNFLQDAHGTLFPYNWARIRSTEVEKYLYGQWWTTNPKQTELQKSFENQYKAAARFLTEDEYCTPGNASRDRFKMVPSSVQHLLDDKKWMKVKVETKRTRRVSTTSSMSEQVASSLLAPSTSLIVPPADQHNETPKEEVITPVSMSSEVSNEQNIDPEFPGVYFKETPKTPKEKLIFPKKGHGVKIDPFAAKTAALAPWAGSSPSPSKNFKEIQEEEAQRERNTPKRSQPVPIVTRRERQSTWREGASGSASTPPISLKSIMADEERRLRPEAKPAKPLEAVAMEEHAIQELLQQYSVEFDGQAVIKVSLASST